MLPLDNLTQAASGQCRAAWQVLPAFESPAGKHPHSCPALPPTAPLRLAERLEAQGCSEPEVCVMAGGWKRFRRELEIEDFELVRVGP